MSNVMKARVTANNGFRSAEMDIEEARSYAAFLRILGNVNVKVEPVER